MFVIEFVCCSAVSVIVGVVRANIVKLVTLSVMPMTVAPSHTSYHRQQADCRTINAVSRASDNVNESYEH